MKAVVKYPAGKPLQYHHGERINAVLTLPDGKDERFFANPGDPLLTSLQKGQAVEVFKDKKGNYQIDADSAAAPAAPFPPATQRPQQAQATTTGNEMPFVQPSRQLKKNMLDYIDFSAKLYSHCFDQAAAALEEINLPDPALKDVATTLYLSVQRRFHLQ